MRSAIIQSGSALHSWNLNPQNKEFATEVAKVLLNRKNIDDIDVSNVLISSTAYALYYAAENATENMKKTSTLSVSIRVLSIDAVMSTMVFHFRSCSPIALSSFSQSDIGRYCAPTLELRAQGAEEKLITRDAESYVIHPEREDIPIIVGETKREWAQFFEEMGMICSPTSPRVGSRVPMT